MFGESESESPRIPSPWDTLMSTPPTNTAMARVRNPSPLALELIPKLVPESDDGNVEYKLQLLDHSPSRFARLVTQLKWRLLEGGGQAYYELGVADSGDLIGLSRDELERSLETLEMMAGEIGASVIVVKEIEVPAGLTSLAKLCKEKVSDTHGTPSSVSPTECGYSSNTSATETETDLDSLSGTDLDECPDLEKTLVLPKGFRSDETLVSMFTMDSETEDTSNATEEESSMFLPPQFDLEISSVFKPRPMKPRVFDTSRVLGGKNKRNKKFKQVTPVQKDSHVGNGAQTKDRALQRRQNRDKKREEKRRNLESQAMLPVDLAQTGADAVSGSPERDVLVDGLKMLHVGVVEELRPVKEDVDILEDDIDLFTAKPGLPSFPSFITSESHLDLDPAAIAGAVGIASNNDEKEYKTLIVEALVVRKMLQQEAFLDFGGFSVC